MIEHIAIALCRALHKSGYQVMGMEIAEIVTDHAIGAAIAATSSAWVPLVGDTIAASISAGFVWSMYYRINSKLGLPFTKNIVKSVATAIGANLLSYLGVVVVASALSVIPGIGTLASIVIMTCACYCLTWTAGLIYLKVLHRFAEKSADFSALGEEEMKDMANDVMATEDIKSMMKEAKSQFKKAKDRGEIKKGKSSVKPIDEA